MTEVDLRDGSRVRIRSLGPADKAGLAAGFERLSELSRYRRFLSPTAHLTATQLAYLTEVDHHDHEALVAIELSSRDGLGVARYVRSTEDPQEAEFAVAVADDWQRRGLGTALLRHLAARAREEGITRLTGLVTSENQPVRNMLATLGRVQQRHAGGGTMEVSLQIPLDPLAASMTAISRAGCGPRLPGSSSRVCASDADQPTSNAHPALSRLGLSSQAEWVP